MKIRPKNFGEALIPLTAVPTVIGHGGSHCLIVQQHPIANAIYATIVTSLYCVAVGFSLDFCVKSNWFGPNDYVVAYITYANIAIAGLARMHSWYHAKIHADYAEEISQVDKTLRRCGSSFDYAKTFKLGIAAISIELIAVSVLTAMEIDALSKSMSVDRILIINCFLNHPVHAKSILICNFSLEVWLIGERFHAANKILEKANHPSQQRITDQAWNFSDDPMNTLTLALSTRQILDGVLRRQHIIQIIKHVHLELCAISKKLNQACGIEIALAMVMYFASITESAVDCYISVRDSLDNQNWRIIWNIGWVCTYFGELLLINQVCAKVSAEAQRTGQIIHCMNRSIGNPELRDEIKQFSLQLIQHPLRFSPAGLFTLGSKFVVQFIASVVTYATIFVQIKYQIRDSQQH